MMEKDRRSRLLNQERLRALRRDFSTEVSIFCAHDIREYEQHSGHSHRESLKRAEHPASTSTSPLGT